MEREAIRKYVAKHKQYAHALPAVNSIQEAIVLATLEYELSGPELQQLRELLLMLVSDVDGNYRSDEINCRRDNNIAPFEGDDINFFSLVNQAVSQAKARKGHSPDEPQVAIPHATSRDESLEEAPLEPLGEAFRTYVQNGKSTLRKLALKNAIEYERKERERKELEKIIDAYEAIPIPNPIKNALAQISRSFLEEGRRDLENLLDEFEELLGEELFDAVIDYLPDIFAVEKQKTRLGH